MEEEYIPSFGGKIRTVVVARKGDAERYSLAICVVKDPSPSRVVATVVALVRLW